MSSAANTSPEPTGVFIDDYPGDTEAGRGDTGGSEEPENRTAEPVRKSDTIAGYPTADPFTFGTDSPNYSGKRRGRPRGPNYKPRTGSNTGTAGTGAEKTAPSRDLGINLEEALLSGHAAVAELISYPEFELEKDEAKKLADALTRVNRYLAVNIDPKHLAFVNLFFVCLMIYGMRYIVWRKTHEKKVAAPTPIRAVPTPQPQQQAQPTATVQQPPKRDPAQGISPQDLWNEPANDHFSL